MKKILLLIMIAFFTKNTNAQVPKHFEVVLTDTILAELDTVFWQIGTNVDYSSIYLDSSILKLKNPILENKARRDILEDSTKKALLSLNLAIRNMKDVYIAPDFIFDNTKDIYNSQISYTYLTTSDAGFKNLVDYCASKKYNLKISNVKCKNIEITEVILRKRLAEKSKKIALAILPSFQGKTVELISISQTNPLSKPNSNYPFNTVNATTYKQLLDDKIGIKYECTLTLKFDYLIK